MYNSSEFDKNFAFLFQIHLTRSSSRFENNDKNAKKKICEKFSNFRARKTKKRDVRDVFLKSRNMQSYFRVGKSRQFYLHGIAASRRWHVNY